jgi:hypothetical protein
MLQRLPPEIVDQIAYYLPYEKGIGLSHYLEKKLNDTFGRDKVLLHPKNAWTLFAHYGNLFRIKWMHFHVKEGCSVEAMNFAAGNGQ